MHNRIPPPTQDNATSWAEYIKAVWSDADNQLRKEQSKKAVDFYRYRQQAYFDQQLRRIITDPLVRATKRRWFQNYTKSFVDDLAQCYSCIVKRSLGDLGPEEQQLISDVLFTEKNAAMRTADKWLNLERTTLVYARWSKKNQRIAYRTYNQYEFDLVFDPNSDDRELMAVILSDYCEFSKSNIYVYTAKFTYHFVGSKLLTSVPNPIEILPFHVMYAEDPGSEDYLEPMSALVEANEELNLALSSLLNLMQNQAHSIPVMTLPYDQGSIGTDDADPNLSTPGRVEGDQRIDLDANKLLVLRSNELGHEANLKYLEQNANFEGALAVVKYLASSLAQSFGGEIAENKAGATATGFYIVEHRRQTMLNDLRLVFKDAERELFKIGMLIAGKERPMPAVNTDDFNVDFSSDQALKDGITVQDLMTLRNMRIGEPGAIDSVEVVRALYPSLERSECEEMLLEFIATEKRLKEAAGIPEMPVEVAPGENPAELDQSLDQPEDEN